MAKKGMQAMPNSVRLEPTTNSINLEAASNSVTVRVIRVRKNEYFLHETMIYPVDEEVS